MTATLEDTDQLVIVSPEGRAADSPPSAAEFSLPTEFDGIRLFLIDNRKEGAVEILESVQAAIGDSLGSGAIHETVWAHKEPRSGLDESSERHLTEHDVPDHGDGRVLVGISGVGDCGSCTMRSCRYGQDVMALGGLPIVACTEPFRPLAEQLLTSSGVPLSALVTVPHPIKGISQEQIDHAAAIIVEAVKRETSRVGIRS